MRRWSHHTVGERGQEAVELAIVLPLLVLIVFGVLDLGRAFHAAIVITNAARVGARYGILSPGDPNGIITVTQAEAQGSGIDLTDTTLSAIEVTCPEGCGSDLPIRVTVTYQFKLILGLVFANPEIQMVRFAEMLVP